jgi:hypothetical protein
MGQDVITLNSGKLSPRGKKISWGLAVPLTIEI